MSEDDSDDIPMQQCEACEFPYPLTKKYFAKAPGCTHKFRRVCRKCQKKRKRQSDLEKIESNAVESFVSRVMSGGTNIPHTAELTEAIMNNFGGVNGFSALLMKQFWDAKPGSRIRSGVLEMISRVTIKNTEQGGARKPIDLYSEEELQSEIDKRIESILLLTNAKKVHDVVSQLPAPAPAGSSAAPFGQLPINLSDRRTQELAERAFLSAGGSTQDVPAIGAAVGVPSGPGE